MQGDRMQQSRLELKYLITETTAESVRDFVRRYLSMGEFGVGKPDFTPFTALPYNVPSAVSRMRHHGA